jgi:hypothetical protein
LENQSIPKKNKINKLLVRGEDTCTLAVAAVTAPQQTQQGG